MTLSVNIHKKLPGFQLDVSFNLENGTLALLGPSGSGKSMTLRCIAGLETPDRGNISLDGRILFDSEKGINLHPQLRKIGFLFQNYALFPHLTISRNIAMGLQGMDKEKREAIIKEKTAMVKLEGLEERYPHQLSGGQQQRAALARALAPQPQILLLDEPFSALDNHLRGEMEQEIRALLHKFSGSAIFVTHNVDEAYRLCPGMVVLENGQVVANSQREVIIKVPPTLGIARMVGCQNLSTCRFQNGEVVEALDWGCLLRLPENNIKKEKGTIGIFSRDIRPAVISDIMNTLECRINDMIESPRHITLQLMPLKSNNSSFIKMSCSKERFDQMDLHLFGITKIHLPPEKLFFIAEDNA